MIMIILLTNVNKSITQANNKSIWVFQCVLRDLSPHNRKITTGLSKFSDKIVKGIMF